METNDMTDNQHDTHDGEAIDPFAEPTQPTPEQGADHEAEAPVEPVSKKTSDPKAPRRPRALPKGQVDPRTTRTVLTLARELDKLNGHDRGLMAGLYRVDADVDSLVVAVLSGVEAQTQHIHDVLAAAEANDPLDAMVTVQTFADADPDRFRNAWAALAEIDATLPKAARPGPKTAAAFVRAAKQIDKATLTKFRAPLNLVR